MNRMLGVLALLVFALFFGVILRKVPHTDLIIVIAIGLVLAIYDFWTQLFGRRR